MESFRGGFQSFDWGYSTGENDRENSEDGGDDRYFSDEDIQSIEEALLQRIHYAEDSRDDGTPFLDDPDPGTKEESYQSYDYEGRKLQNVSVRIMERRDAAVERSKVVDERGDERISEPSHLTNRNPEEKLREPGDVTRKRVKRLKVEVVKDVESSLSQEDPSFGSDNESKYKMIKPRKQSEKVTGKMTETTSNPDDENISDGSISDGDSPRVIAETTKTSLVNSKVDVEPVYCRDSESGTESNSETGSQRISKRLKADGDSAETSRPSSKRSWRKAEGSGESGPAPAPKKLKIKRAVIDDELRAALDSVKGMLSGEDSSDAMAIESHSEDEALDVHFDSKLNPGGTYNQGLRSDNRRQAAGRGRYYQEPVAWPKFKCYNCLEFGHMTKDCRLPKQRKVITCVLCGTKGHSDRQCPDALCFVCSTAGHQAKDCPNKKDRYRTCRRCSVSGHVEKSCPDRWRQYHLTTEPGRIICDNKSALNGGRLVAVNGKVFCYNCSKEGHFGHECQEETMDRYCPLILPYVTKYDYVPKRFWKLQMDVPEPAKATPITQAPDQRGKVTAPSAVQKKPVKDVRKRLEHDEEVESRAPPLGQKQRRKAQRKREREEAEVEEEAKVGVAKRIQLDDSAKPIRIKSKEYKALTKKERRRVRREHRKRLKKQIEDLSPFNVKDLGQEGAQDLPTGPEGTWMSGVDVDMSELNHVVIVAKKTKIKTKQKLTKVQRKERKKQRERGETRPSAGELQTVTFRPDAEQFARLDKKFGAQPPGAEFEAEDGTRRAQGTTTARRGRKRKADPDEGNAEMEASAIDKKKKKKKAKLKFRKGDGQSEVLNISDNILRGQESVQPGVQSKKKQKKDGGKTFGKRQKKILKDKRNSQHKQKAADPQIVSARGFRMQPQYQK